jgi:hypothetical protein
MHAKTSKNRCCGCGLGEMLVFDNVTATIGSQSFAGRDFLPISASAENNARI